MHGSIIQALALTVAGNACIQGVDVGPFWPEAEAFAFCNEVRFATTVGIVAADPNHWLRQLPGSCACVRLGALPRNEPGLSDRAAVGFANCGPRWLIGTSPDGNICTWWEPEWRVSGRSLRPRAESRPWSVTYWRQFESHPIPGARQPSAILADISDALDAMAEFVERAAPQEAIPGWAEGFRAARKLIDKDDGTRQRGDPGPEGFLTTEAYRLIHACRAAWVFGGMGSWNDGAYWGSVEAEGDDLSERLFDLLRQGIVAAANSTARPANGG